MALTSFQVSIVKSKAKSAFDQQKCKDYEKRDRILVSKFNYQISQQKIIFTY